MRVDGDGQHVTFDGEILELFRLGSSAKRLDVREIAHVTVLEQRKARGPILHVTVDYAGTEIPGMGVPFPEARRAEVVALAAELERARGRSR
jgi:hypothetical protein